MAEFWKSNSKHHCKICNVWMADNKMSIASHENGFKHREKVLAQKKEKRDAKLHGASSERELNTMLADIEKAAKSAISDDRDDSSAMFIRNQTYGAPPPPPSLVPAASSSGGPRKHNSDRPTASSSFSTTTTGTGGGEYDDDESQEKLPPVEGMYSVLGQSYLEGSVVQDKIRPNMQCEVFLEDLDDWYVGFVSSRTDTPIPNTERFVSSFDAVYALPISATLPQASMLLYSPSLSLAGTDSISESEQLLNAFLEFKQTQKKQHTAENQTLAAAVAETETVRNVLEKGIKSDRIRLYADKEGNIVNPIDAILEVLNAPPAPVIDENTGLGGWQTVAVREYDEEAERELQKNSIEKMFKGEADDIDTTLTAGTGAGAGNKRSKKDSGDDGEGHVESMDSALSAYNPHKSATYKGIRLTETADVKEQIDSISGGLQISFKKRKRPQCGRVSSTIKDED